MTKYAITFTLDCGLEKTIVDDCKMNTFGFTWTKTGNKVILYSTHNIVSIELLEDD